MIQKNFAFQLLVALVLVSVPTTAWIAITTPKQVPEHVRLLILPGFGNSDTDYFLEQAPQGSLVVSLKNRGWKDDQIHVMSLKRSDWLQVFLNGAFDLKFWQANAPPTRPAFSWYLNKIQSSIDELTRDKGTQVVLIGHSAGGWLARAGLGFGSTGDQENDFASAMPLDRVLGLVTLGAPHLPPPPTIMDMTRGALRITNEQFPGAYHVDKGLFYITVIGNVIQGERQERKSPLERTTPTEFAFNSYEAVCGQGDAIGDGVVPVCSAHLDGATQLDLAGIYHSINVPDRWYGSDSVIDSWHAEMIRAIEDQRQRDVGPGTLLTKLGGIFG